AAATLRIDSGLGSAQPEAPGFHLGTGKEVPCSPGTRKVPPCAAARSGLCARSVPAPGACTGHSNRAPSQLKARADPAPGPGNAPAGEGRLAAGRGLRLAPV